MKKISSIVLCVLLIAALAITTFAAGSVSFSMSASKKTLYRGDTVTLTVKSSSSAEATSYGLMLSYNTSVFELVSGKCTATGTKFDSFQNGFALLFSDPVAYSGSVGTVTLKVKDDAPIGNYTVSGSASVKNGDDTVSASGCSVSLTVTCNHSYGAWTKAENGHQQTCSKCGTVKTEAHKEGTGKVTKPATCKEEGEKTFTCTVCKATRTEVIEKTNNHTFGNLTPVDDNSHKDTCSVCQKEITEGHKWNSGKVTKPATCKQEGEKTFTCTGCKATKTEKLPVLTTHTWSKWQKIDADTHKRNCTVCEKEETGNHSYNTYWSKDSKNHWHECSACKDRQDEEKHIPGPAATETTAQTCKVCKYVIKAALGHTHNYAKEWTTDAGGHWYACSGCEEKGSYAAHDFENACDPDCAICTFTRETAHDYGDSWVTDGENHWHECSGCGDIQDKDAHIPGAAATETTAQTCTVCGYELAPALGVPETEPTTPTQSDIEIEGPFDEKKDFPVWILIVAVVAVVGVVAFVVIKKKN